MLCVDYRLAPEHPFPTPLDDCYTALIWLHEHARELNVDATRIGLYGDSAGGGLAAGVALLARDRGLSPPLAKQVLVAPMLDDRIATHDAELAPFLVFSYDDKITSWAAYLGPSTRTGTHDSLSSSRPITNTSSSNNAVPAPICKYAAPARETDLVGLPATYLEVGELDCFRDEVLDYTRRLVSTGVGVEFHLYPGCFHAFDVFVPNAGVSQRAKTNLIRALRSF
ncbi:Alpha/Beta hydrolase protein [Aspergillus lucknowensis]|uniref:Alpha/Beta hydrolase protein n=1 Tax=Aspergillus lucknowensis TaxID=176173 RepID=A0ABR4LCC7_9EURO